MIILIYSSEYCLPNAFLSYFKPLAAKAKLVCKRERDRERARHRNRAQGRHPLEPRERHHHKPTFGQYFWWSVPFGLVRYLNCPYSRTVVTNQLYQCGRVPEIATMDAFLDKVDYNDFRGKQGWHLFRRITWRDKYVNLFLFGYLFHMIDFLIYLSAEFTNRKRLGSSCIPTSGIGQNNLS